MCIVAKLLYVSGYHLVRRLASGDIVSHGTQFSPKAEQPQFLANVSFGQTVGWTMMPLGMEVGLGTGDIVLDGDRALQKKTHSPHPILAQVYCGQTALWIKIPLGTDVNLGSGDVVLDAVTVARTRGTVPSFRPMSIVAKLLDG